MVVRAQFHIVQVNDIPTTYLDAGSGRTLVALHGIPTSSALFEPLLAHLTDVRLLAPDLLGQGGTSVPSSGRLDYAAYYLHLCRLLDLIAPARFSLLVHDFGGILGLHWASHHPERVERLIVLSTTVAWTVRWEMLWRLITVGNLLCGWRGIRWSLPFTLKRLTHLDASVATQWARPWTRQRVWRGSDLFARPHLDRLQQELPHLDMPLLAIWGEQDSIFPVHPYADLLRQAVPHTRLTCIARCGHWSPLDAPQEVAQAIGLFLQEEQ